MKFLHTGDLHIGKTVNEFSMLEEQRYALSQMIEIAVSEKTDAVVIAGDVYDRPVPSTEAVELLDYFLTTLLGKGIQVIMISGNHDSGERVAFADKILEKQGLHIAGGYHGVLKRVGIQDEWGEVDFVCMPFVRPSVASVEEMLASTPMVLDMCSRHVLVTHYFVTGENGQMPQLADSETRVSVGGLDNVGAGAFAAFDYVALGHIHKCQKIGEREVWYAGSPIKYSFSEVNQIKSVNLVTMEEKGRITVEIREIKPVHEMRIIKGELDKLICAARTEEEGKQDYIKAVLTNREELIDPIGSLRCVYPNVMQIELEKNRNVQEGQYMPSMQEKKKTTGELFADFYELLTGGTLDEKRRQIVDETAAEAQQEQE